MSRTPRRRISPRLAGLGVCVALACGTPPDGGRGGVAAAEPSLAPEATAALVEAFQAELDAAWAQAQETDENFPGRRPRSSSRTGACSASPRVCRTWTTRSR